MTEVQIYTKYDEDSPVWEQIEDLPPFPNIESRLTAVEDYTPGIELGYAERLNPFSTTNVSSSSTAAASKIGSLLVTTIGSGRPAAVEVFAPMVYHGATANQSVTLYLIVNGVAQSTEFGQSAIGSSPYTGSGRSLLLSRRVVLVQDVEYTFEVGVAGGSAGTSNIFCSTAAPAFMAVTGR